MGKHKVDWGPGLRFFECNEPDCLHKWDEISRDCISPSGSVCHECGDSSHPVRHEKHYEWPTDSSGNLLKDYDYRSNLNNE